MACPICGRVYCDHSASDRGQSFEEMIGDANCGLPINDDEPENAVRHFGSTFYLVKFTSTPKDLARAYDWFVANQQTFRWPYRNDPAIQDFIGVAPAGLPGAVVTLVSAIQGAPRKYSFMEYEDGAWVQRQEFWDDPSHLPRALFALCVRN